jgi:outer membrane protein insertion porin family
VETGPGRRRLGDAASRGLGRALPLVVLLALPASAKAQFDPAEYDSLQGRTVSRMDVSGNNKTRPYVIWREVRTRVGRPLDVKVLAGDVTRLHDLGIFGAVEIEASPDSAGVSLDYHVTEMPRFLPAPTLSYSDANGWSYGVSITALNVRGRDIDLSGRVLVGGTTTYGFLLNDPWIRGNHLGAGLVVARLDRDDYLDGFQERSFEATPSVSTWIGKYGRARAVFSWFDISSNVPGKTLSPTDTDHLRRLGAGIGFDSRDATHDARRGWYFDFDATRTGGPLGGNGDFWTTNVDARRYQPISGVGTLLLAGLLSLQTGTLDVTFPEYLQYRMGGENSIRGYDLDSLGATLYGQNQLIGTVELQHPILGQRPVHLLNWTVRLGLDVAVFSDQGVAWTASSDLTLPNVWVGGGAGLRLRVPGVSVVRLDFAVGRGGGIKLGLASLPKVVAQRRRVR